MRLDTLTFSNKPSIDIIHDMTTNEIYSAAQNWVLRTRNYTAESLAEYIRNKGVHEAYSVSQYKELTGIDPFQKSQINGEMDY